MTERERANQERRELYQQIWLLTAQLEAAERRINRLVACNAKHRHRVRWLKNSRKLAWARVERMKKTVWEARSEARLQRELRLGRRKVAA